MLIHSPCDQSRGCHQDQNGVLCPSHKKCSLVKVIQIFVYFRVCVLVPYNEIASSMNSFEKVTSSLLARRRLETSGFPRRRRKKRMAKTGLSRGTFPFHTTLRYSSMFSW